MFSHGTRSRSVRSISPPNTESLGTRASASTLGQKRKLPTYKATSLALACLALALTASTAQGQMDPAEMQRHIEQQMGGGSLGSNDMEAGNRVGRLISAVGASGADIARSAREHPRTAAAMAVGASTTAWVVTEGRRSGLLLWRRPRISLFRPSDASMSKVLDAAAGAPIASPLRGIILSTLPDPDAEEEVENENDDDAHAGSGVETLGGRNKRGSGADKSTRKKVGSGRVRSRSLKRAENAGEIHAAIAKARDARSAGGYMETTEHGRGRVKSVCAGVKVGLGLGLYHKFAQGLGNLDVFDGRSDCDLLATDSSEEDLGSTLGLLTHPAWGTWSLSPVRVVIRRETSISEPHAARDGSRSHRNESGSGRGGSASSGNRKLKKKKSRKRKFVGKNEGPGKREKGDEEGGALEHTKTHRQYTLALSAVEGAGWSGTWVFRVTYDADTDEVWFQTTLSQRREAFWTTPGGDQESKVKKVNEDMLERGKKHVAVLKTREHQFARVSSLARRRARDKKILKRDRILNPDKYKRVHRYMREDAHTTGGRTARPVRWGEERRRNDIRLK